MVSREVLSRLGVGADSKSPELEPNKEIEKPSRGMFGYVAASLDRASAAAIEKLAAFKDVRATHATVYYRPKVATFDTEYRDLAGRVVTLKVRGIVQNDRVQVLVCEPIEGVRLEEGRTLHVVISLAPGVSPGAGLHMLKALGDFAPTPCGITELTATIGFIEF